MQQTGQDTVLPGVAWLLRFVACPGMWSARRVLRPVYNADADVYGGTGARAAPVSYDGWHDVEIAVMVAWVPAR